MSVIPPLCSVRFGDVFPRGCVALGVEPVRGFSGDAASVQPVPQVRVSGFVSPTAGFEGLTITAYAGRGGVAGSVRATGLCAPGVGRAGTAGGCGETASMSAAA